MAVRTALLTAAIVMQVVAAPARAQDRSDWPTLPLLDPLRVGECWAIYTDAERKAGPEAKACTEELYPCTPHGGPSNETPPVVLNADEEREAIACYRANTERLRHVALAMIPKIVPELTEEARIGAVLNLMRMLRDHATNCARGRDRNGADARACDQFIWIEIIAGGARNL